MTIKKKTKENNFFFFSNYMRNLSDCNGTRTHNHLVPKRTLNNLAKVAKWLSCVMSTYLYGAFDCMLLSCHVRLSEWIHTLYLPECQGTPCSKQAQYLKFKWVQRFWHWHSGKYSVWIHSERRTWHDNNIQLHEKS